MMKMVVIWEQRHGHKSKHQQPNGGLFVGDGFVADVTHLNRESYWCPCRNLQQGCEPVNFFQLSSIAWMNVCMSIVKIDLTNHFTFLRHMAWQAMHELFSSLRVLFALVQSSSSAASRTFVAWLSRVLSKVRSVDLKAA